MFDNGLLENYPFFASSKGFLKMRNLNYKFLESDRFFVVQKYSLGEGKYYFKKEKSDEIDSQVLLSQIYKKAGLNSAIYLPSLSPQNHRGTISNDITSSSNISAKQFFFNLYKLYPKEVVDGELVRHTKSSGDETQIVLNCNESLRSKLMMFDHSVKSPSLEQFEKTSQPPFKFVELFTKEGMRDFIKMHLFDTASSNTDRNSSNFYFEYNNEGKICGITTIDHSMSQESILYDYPDYAVFCNFLGEPCETDRRGMITELKENETVQDFLPVSEMAEMVGNIDVVDAAREIKNETGYSVNSEYVEYLAISYDKLANDLAK